MHDADQYMLVLALLFGATVLGGAVVIGLLGYWLVTLIKKWRGQ